METNPTPQPKTQLGDRSDGELTPPFKVVRLPDGSCWLEDANEHCFGTVDSDVADKFAEALRATTPQPGDVGEVDLGEIAAQIGQSIADSSTVSLTHSELCNIVECAIVPVRTLARQLTDAQARESRMREELERYGRHDNGGDGTNECASIRSHDDSDCTCGLATALAGARGGR